MTRRRLWRILGAIAPLVGFVVILTVLHGAGVPLTLPGVIVVLLLIVAARVVFGFTRRRRTGPR